MKVALIRGKFLNAYEMQLFEKLDRRFEITAFGSLTPLHDQFSFPVVKLPSPMDLPNFHHKMQILNRLFIDAHYLWGLEEKLRGFDIVHTAETYFHYTQQALHAKKKGYVKKVVATVWETIPFNNEGIWGRKRFKERALRQIDHFIAVTEKAKGALIREGAQANKISVLGPAIDIKRFTPAKILKKKQLTILFVGRLEEEKGIGEFIEAAIRCKKHNIRFVMIGSGSKLKFVPSFIEQRIVSYEKMPKEYQQADIFVAPSKPSPTWDEQYNMALLEAQASGLPIVTTRTGAIAENVGDAAVLVSPEDTNELAAAVKNFIENPKLRALYGKKARQRALSLHDSKKKARRMGEIYDNLL